MTSGPGAWQVGMISMRLTLKCGGRSITHATASAIIGTFQNSARCRHRVDEVLAEQDVRRAVIPDVLDLRAERMVADLDDQEQAPKVRCHSPLIAPAVVARLPPCQPSRPPR